MTKIEEIIQKFEELRTERWELVNELLESSNEVDDLLADTANLITMIYLARQMTKSPGGFQSFDRKKKDD